MDLPMMITVVDRPDRMDRLIQLLREMAPNELIVVQDVEVVQSGAPAFGASSGPERG